MMDKCSIQDHINFTGKERELGRIANPAQRHDTEQPQSQPNVAVSNIRHDGLPQMFERLLQPHNLSFSNIDY